MADAGEQIVEVLNAPVGNGSWQPAVGNSTLLLRDYLVEERILPSVQSANRVINEACRTLSQCVPPTGTEQARTGLVCGYVQSGKTASMTAVSALAKDNGYRIVVLIAGVTTNLVAQNRDRLETHLRAAASEWAWLMLTESSPWAKCTRIRSTIAGMA